MLLRDFYHQPNHIYFTLNLSKKCWNQRVIYVTCLIERAFAVSDQINCYWSSALETTHMEHSGRYFSLKNFSEKKIRTQMQQKKFLIGYWDKKTKEVWEWLQRKETAQSTKQKHQHWLHKNVKASIHTTFCSELPRLGEKKLFYITEECLGPLFGQTEMSPRNEKKVQQSMGFLFGTCPEQTFCKPWDRLLTPIHHVLNIVGQYS